MLKEGETERGYSSREAAKLVQLLSDLLGNTPQIENENEPIPHH